mmetsp:Transcript_15362/g.37789  ORF Transcript_15362/g.37789 Transcript_15362/m.37789 type:complete len:303 (-) Transcript_15362:178-1086(-)
MSAVNSMDSSSSSSNISTGAVIASICIFVLLTFLGCFFDDLELFFFFFLTTSWAWDGWRTQLMARTICPRALGALDFILGTSKLDLDFFGDDFSCCEDSVLVDLSEMSGVSGSEDSSSASASNDAFSISCAIDCIEDGRRTQLMARTTCGRALAFSFLSRFFFFFFFLSFLSFLDDLSFFSALADVPSLSSFSCSCSLCSSSSSSSFTISSKSISSRFDGCRTQLMARTIPGRSAVLDDVESLDFFFLCFLCFFFPLDEVEASLSRCLCFFRNGGTPSLCSDCSESSGTDDRRALPDDAGAL